MRACHLIESELDGNVNLYDATRNEVHILNETASDIWRLLEDQHSLGAIVQLLAGSYAVDPQDIGSYVADTISTFSSLGLLSDGG